VVVDQVDQLVFAEVVREHFPKLGESLSLATFRIGTANFYSSRLSS